MSTRIDVQNQSTTPVASAGAMTLVASVLFVMLLTRPIIERRRDILDGQARAELPSVRPITSFYSGADS